MKVYTPYEVQNQGTDWIKAEKLKENKNTGEAIKKKQKKGANVLY